jgi:hypothetical protein
VTGDNAASQPYKLEVGDKVTPIMAYTDSALILGDVITREAMRVSTWLRTQAIPQYLVIHNASLVRFGGGQPRPVKFNELLLPTNEVSAYHITPPGSNPLDYDPKESMRKMEPATVLVGWFRFEGFLRMSTITNLERFLDSSKEVFTSVYDVTISQSAVQGMNPIRVPFVLGRGGRALFAPREV